jgi:hypothetical protein
VYAACSIAGAARWKQIVEPRLIPGVSTATLAATCALCGACGTGNELDLLFRTTGFDVQGACRQDFERATTAVLLRDSAGLDLLDGLMSTVSADVQDSVVSAVESTKKMEAAVLLARWIGARRSLRLAALPHLARLALSLEKPFPEEALQPVRILLDQVEGELLPDAIVCAGRLGDYSAIPQLTRWLREGDAGVKADALWALRQISGLVFDEDPALWQTWYAGESTWWEHDSRAAFESLRTGSRVEKVQALRAIAALHAWREKLADRVVVLLDDPDADLAKCGVRLLGRLGSRSVVPNLLDALSNASISDAAHDALEAIAHKKLPADPAGCREALGVAP